MAKSRKDLQDVREKVTGKVEDLAAKAEAKGLTREHAAEVRDDLRAKGEKVLNDPARRNKAGVAITAAAAAVVAVVLAGWRIIRRRRSE